MPAAMEKIPDPLDELLPPQLPKQFKLNSVEESKDPVAIKNQSAEFVKAFVRLVLEDEKLYEYMKSKHEDFIQRALLLIAEIEK